MLRLVESPAEVEANLTKQWNERNMKKLMRPASSGDNDSITVPMKSAMALPISAIPAAEIRAAVSASIERLKRNVKESVEKAREAVAMDLMDGESWCM